MTGNFWAALTATLFFAVHPLHCETVVEVGYREDLLATFFLLAGLNAAAAFDPRAKGKTWTPAILTVGCLFLSAASKESGIAGPAVLVVFWFLFRRDQPAAQWAWRGLIAVTLGAVGTFFVLRFALEPKPSVIFISPAQPIAASGLDWMLAQSRIWWAEFLRILWPSDLCADYGPYNLRNLNPVLALTGVFALLIVQAILAFGNRKAALACAIFWGAMLPVSNLIPIYHPMADRYLYMPMVGVALLLALALAGIKSGTVRRWTTAAALAGVAVLLVATLQLQPVWRDDLSLWKETALQNPLGLNGWLGQGYANLEHNQPAEALGYFQYAVSLTHGQSAEPFGGIALAAEALGQHEEASKALALATKLDSRYARPDNLVRALAYPAYQAQQFYLIAHRNP
jgi:hypothetical protein